MTITLTDTTLGEVELSCEPAGYTVVGFEVGWAQPREVVDPAALRQGVDDRTRFAGARVITVSVRLNTALFPAQELIDRVAPFLDPARRPRLAWSVGAGSARRSIVVRAADAPVVIDGKYPSMVMTFVSADRPLLEAETLTCATVRRSGATEAGRTYDLAFDRSYAFMLPTGSIIVNNNGTGPAPWFGDLFAEVEDPTITINGVAVAFSGLTLTAGQFVSINCRTQTMLRNGDPNDSVYGLTNFSEWDWSDLSLVGADNVVRFTGDNLSSDARFSLCWRHTWW